MQCHVMPCNDIQWFKMTCNDTKQHVVVCSDMQWCAIACNGMQWHEMVCNDIRMACTYTQIKDLDDRNEEDDEEATNREISGKSIHTACPKSLTITLTTK